MINLVCKKSIIEARNTIGTITIRININQAIEDEQQIIVGMTLVSLITRTTIDILKEYYREELSLSDWQLVKELKIFLNIS